MTLGQIPVQRKDGSERFHAAGVPQGAAVRDFWAWAGSDLISNAQRGVLAEYLVAHAVGVADGVRTEWDAYDLVTPEGIKVEVKSSGYVQSWEQARLSKIIFDIAPKFAWEAVTNTYAAERLRSADVYVFAVHVHTDQESIDALNVNQWEFYVVGTPALSRACAGQKSIGLSRLQTLSPPPVAFSNLKRAIMETGQRA